MLQILDNGGLHRRKRKKYQRYLRNLCGIFAILPSSFVLESTFDERETKPFAAGGFSDVYKATLNRRPVVIKSLKFTTTTDIGEVHRVSG